jgi:hypothetical protein
LLSGSSFGQRRDFEPRSGCSWPREIERLRRILGHTTYVMVIRYVHLDKGDLAMDVDLRSPF